MSASCYPSVAKKVIFQNFMQRIRFKLVNFSSNAFEWKIDVASLQLKILFYDLCVVHLCMKFACADDWQIVRIFWHILPTPDLTHLHYSFLDLPLFPPKIYSNLFKCWHKNFKFPMTQILHFSGIIRSFIMGFRGFIWRHCVVDI